MRNPCEIDGNKVQSVARMLFPEGDKATIIKSFIDMKWRGREIYRQFMSKKWPRLFISMKELIIVDLTPSEKTIVATHCTFLPSISH